MASPVRRLMAWLLAATLMACTPRISADRSPRLSGPGVPPVSELTEPRAGRVYVKDGVCLAACVSTYVFIKRPPLIVYDDGSVLSTPFAAATTAGWIDLEWLHGRLTDCRAEGDGVVNPVGVGFADGGPWSSTTGIPPAAPSTSKPSNWAGRTTANNCLTTTSDLAPGWSLSSTTSALRC